MGGFVSDFFESVIWTHILLPLIIIIIILWMISRFIFGKPLGLVIMELMGNRPLNLDEIDAQVHSRIFEMAKRSCKFSDDRHVRGLYIRSTDDIHYTENGGMHYIGRVSGVAANQQSIMVMFKERAWSFRRYIFIAPPDLLLSSISARNIVFDGMSVRNLEADFFYPIPSQSNKRWDENKMDWWAICEFYEMRRVQSSTMMFTQVGETTGLQSASGTAGERAQLEALKYHQYHEEVPPSAQQPAEDPAFLE